MKVEIFKAIILRKISGILKSQIKLITIYGKYPFIEKNNPDIKKLYELGRTAA
jgi:hypothetical protein